MYSHSRKMSNKSTSPNRGIPPASEIHDTPQAPKMPESVRHLENENATNKDTDTIVNAAIEETLATWGMFKPVESCDRVSAS